MADAQFDPTAALVVIAVAITLLPFTASVALALRAVRGTGRVQKVAAAGLVMAAAYAILLLFFPPAPAGAVLPVIRLLFAGLIAAWLWTAWASPGGRWLDAAWSMVISRV